MENKKIMKDMNRVKVTVIGVIAALAVNFMGVDKVQAQNLRYRVIWSVPMYGAAFYQTGVSFQPTLGFGIGGFFIDGMGLYRFRRNKFLGG